MSLLSKIRNLNNIGKVTKASNTPQIKTFENELIDKVPYFQQSGIASIPLNETTVLILCSDGNKNNPVVVADNTQSPIEIEAGEVIIYNDEDNYIHVKASGDIEVKTSKIKLITGDIILDVGDITATAGDVYDNIGSLDELRQEYLTHVHPITQPSGTPSLPPTQP
jgi:phage gp45-like